MPIDFHAAVNRRTYSGRLADETWSAAIRELIDPAGADVVDIGCGGGTYTRAWHELGAATVTGVDFSAPILESARTDHADLPGVRFHHGTAADTGLPGGTADVVWERALVHHVPDLAAVLTEARRLLRPDGVYLIQDRTIDDVSQPGSITHPRGWLFEIFPRLLVTERARRPDAEMLARLLTSHGLNDVTSHQVWETRRRHSDREDYLEEIRTRVGRSILHELSDRELEDLISELRRRLPAGPVEERDRWTIWRAVHSVSR